MKNSITTTKKSARPIGRWLLCALFLLGITATNVNAQLVNIPCTGYNNDIIASPDGSYATNTASTGTTPGVTYPTIGVDGNAPGAYTLVASNYKWYSGGTLATCGLTSGGSYASASTAGLTYVIQSTTANNALTVTSGTYTGNPFSTTGTMTLVSPAKYTKLYVMYESVLNASAPTMTATITFTDLSTQVIPGNVLVNWFTTPAAGNLAYSGTMQRTNNAAPGTLSTCAATGPILFEMGLPINPANYSKFVQSVSFSYSNTIGNSVGTVNYFHVLAVGGLTVCSTPSDQASALTQGVCRQDKLD